MADANKRRLEAIIERETGVKHVLVKADGHRRVVLAIVKRFLELCNQAESEQLRGGWTGRYWGERLMERDEWLHVILEDLDWRALDPPLENAEVLEFRIKWATEIMAEVMRQRLEEERRRQERPYGY
jgi:hypothetical protein